MDNAFIVKMLGIGNVCVDKTTPKTGIWFPFNENC